MGFDLFMLETPSEWPAAYQPMFEDQPEYWRFQNDAMAGMVALMAEAGVLDAVVPQPEFPDWPPPGLSDERAGELEGWVYADAEEEESPTAAEAALLEPFRRHLREILRTRSASAEFVPMFKFQTNDGWIVGPEECAVIAEGLRETVDSLRVPEESGLTRDEGREWILNWAAYNEVAARHGGYKVL
jgi:hypothetical protein